MEQEQTLYKIKDVSKLTGELFLKILFYMTETIQDRIQTYQANKTFVGETNWNKFMATDAPKEIKQFRSEEMNLERLKEYLNDYQIGFSVREMPDSTMTLAFETKNKAMVEQAFTFTFDNLVSNLRSHLQYCCKEKISQEVVRLICLWNGDKYSSLFKLPFLNFHRIITYNISYSVMVKYRKTSGCYC